MTSLAADHDPGEPQTLFSRWGDGPRRRVFRCFEPEVDENVVRASHVPGTPGKSQFGAHSAGAEKPDSVGVAAVQTQELRGSGFVGLQMSVKSSCVVLAIGLALGLMASAAHAASSLQVAGTAPAGAVFAAGGDGTLVLVTEEGTLDTTRAVRVSFVTPTGQVQPTVRLLLPARQYVGGVAVAVDATGTATVSWEQTPRARRGRPHHRVRVVRCRAGECGRVRTLGKTDLEAQIAVAVDGRGRSVVLWRDGIFPAARRPSLAWARGGDSGFTSPRRIGKPGSFAQLLRLPDGSVLAAWQASRYDLPGVRTARLTTSGRVFRLSRTIKGSGQPHLALAHDRVLLAIADGYGSSKIGEPYSGQVAVRFGVLAGGVVRFGSSHTVVEVARDVTVAAGVNGRAVIAFTTTPNVPPRPLVSVYYGPTQAQAVLLEPGASSFGAPQALAPVSKNEWATASFSAGVRADGTARVGIAGQARTTEEGGGTTPSLLATLVPGQPAISAAVPSAGTGQPVLVAGGASASRADDGSWSFERDGLGS